MVGIACRNISGDGRPRPNTVYSLHRVAKSGVVKPHSMVGQGASLNSGASTMARAMIGKIPSLPRVDQKALRVFSTAKCLEKIR